MVGAWSGKPNPIVPKGALYTSMSPVATYMYGEVPIRIKIRPKTSFVVDVFCDEETPHKPCYRNLIYQDFTIYDANVIESWSFGTAEHYDEIVRDILRISSGKRGIGYTQKAPYGSGLNRLFSFGGFDGHRSDEESLKKVLLEMIRMILNNEGRIYYSDGACQPRSSLCN